jgi:Flp pilus assembly protein TadG
MLLSRFYRDRDGAIAPMFAAMLVPLIGLAGAAVDYSRAAAARTDLQASLDATVLMLSKEAGGLTSEQLQQRATEYFQALFKRPEAKGVTVTPTYTVQNGTPTIKLAATGSVDTIVMHILGNKTTDLGSSSEVTWGYRKLEVALALDNTGSMASNNKMTELKKAAKALVDTLQKASRKDGDIKIAVIPFNTDVNVGTDKVNANWIDWTDWDSVNGDCSQKKYTTQGECLANLKIWTAHAHNTWNGCVTDRDKNLLLVTLDYDVTDVAPDTLLKKGAVPGASGQPLSGANAAAYVGLGHDHQQDRCDDPERQYQRHHRHGLGMARAHHRCAVDRGVGAGLRSRQGADPAH